MVQKNTKTEVPGEGVVLWKEVPWENLLRSAEPVKYYKLEGVAKKGNKWEDVKNLKNLNFSKCAHFFSFNANQSTSWYFEAPKNPHILCEL